MARVVVAARGSGQCCHLTLLGIAAVSAQVLSFVLQFDNESKVFGIDLRRSPYWRKKRRKMSL